MTVLVHGLTFHSHHGVTDVERQVGQWLEGDVEVDVSGTVGETDKLDDTVDYVELSQLLVETSKLHNSHTLEHLAERYAFDVLERWPIVTNVIVGLRKPNPLVSPTVAAFGVRLEKSR